MPFAENDPVVKSGGFSGGRDAVLGGSKLSPRQAQDIGDAIISVLQNSATGLLVRGKTADVTMDPDAPWYQRAAAGVGGVIADLPLSVAAAVPAAAAGPIAAGAAAFAAPMALRDALIELYGQNQALTWSGAWEIAKAAAIGGTKGAIIGGATMGAGRVVGAALPAAAPLARGAATVGAEVSALTATASALEGKMPTWQEFMDNAILLGGLKGAVTVAGGLRGIYAETGKRPAEVAADAARDPTIRTALEKQEMPEAYRELAVQERIKAALDADKRPELMQELIRQAEKPDSPILVDPVRYEYITDRATAEGVVRAAETAYREAVETQRRGVVPTAEAMAEGVKLVQEGKIDARNIGEGANSAEIAARALLTKGAAEHARKLAESMPTDPAQWTLEMKLQMAGAMERVGLFYGELAGAGAEAGRSLQMLRQIKRNPEMLGDAESLVKLYERKGNMTDIAQLVRTLKDPEQMRKFTEEYQKATGLDMVIEGWKAAILSGPLTTGANVIGNVLRFGAEIPTAALTATLEAGRLAAKGDPMSTALFRAKALSPLYGVMLGAKDAVTIAAEVWKQKGEHLEKADVYKAAIPGKAGDIIRFPFRVLQVQDAFFRTFGERARAYELAVERAGKEGLSPDTREFNEAVKRYTDTPQLGLSDTAAQKITADIQKTGAEWIFAQQLGPRFENVSRAVAGSPVEFIFPFRRTPVNLTSWAAQYTPGLNLMSARWWNDYNAGGELKSRAIARVAIGTGLAMTAFAMAESGALTGGGLFDKEQSGTKRGAGWQPYSLKIGDTYYSIARMEPVAKPLMLAADMYEMMQASEDKGYKAKLGAMAVLAFGNATISTTYMSGIANAMKATLEPDRYLESFIEQYATSLVPKIVGQTVTLTDPYQREVNGALDAIQSQLPFIREKLLPARDVWGEPKQNNKWFDVMPVATSQASQDKVKTEAVRLEVAIAPPPKSIQERGPFKPSEKSTEMTPEQRNIFQEVAGKQAMTILAPIVNSPDWDRIPDFAKATIYQRVIEGARKQGAYAALPPTDAAREQLRRKLVDEIIRQTDEVKAPEKRVKATQ